MTQCSQLRFVRWVLAAVIAFATAADSVRAEGQWEVTPQSTRAAKLGLKWLAEHQRPAGNWQTQHLGLDALGVLAFLSAGYTAGKGKYGDNVKRGLDYLVTHPQPSGLFNMAEDKRDMYNHGLTTFVLTQAYGMSPDPRVGRVLDRALRLISDVQCRDGGWNYEAHRDNDGHDLSLTVMQAKALRGALDIGMEIPPRTINKAIDFVRQQYRTTGKPDGKGQAYANQPMARRPGEFVYDRHRDKFTTAMAAAGAVCMQEFGKYSDFRIQRSLDSVLEDIKKKKGDWNKRTGKVPFDAYTLYYVSEGLYQVGGKRWREGYPPLRDALVNRQAMKGDDRGSWGANRGVPGHGRRLFGTAVGVVALNIPNRYLPILQEVELRPNERASAK